MADDVKKILTVSGDTPHQRFIRTFEMDAAAIQKGNIPGLTAVSIEEPVDTPAEPKKIVPKEKPEAPPPAPEEYPAFRPVELPHIVVEAEPAPEPLPPPPPPVPEPAPPPPPPPKPLPPPPPPRPKPAPPPPPPRPLPPPPQPKPVAPMHTFTSDLQDRIKETRASTATILAAEGDAGKPRPVARPSYNFAFIIGGVLLLTLGMGSGYAVFLYLHAPTAVNLQPTASAPIFVNERVEVAGRGDVLMGAIETSIHKTLAPNTIRLLTLTAASTTVAEDIFHALEFEAPDKLLRNIEREGGMAGIENTDGVSAPFFILKVSSYGDTFAGMLAWEPRMGLDLRRLFPPRIASTTQTVAIFKDKVVANHDTRIATDQAGNDLMMYGYWDPTTLILARDERAFALIVERLSTSKTQH